MMLSVAQNVLWRALRNTPGQGVSVPPVILTFTLIARNLERP